MYREPFLAEAMVNLNMIDTIGSGIKRMFTKQRERYFPMPDYDLSEPERVKVRIIGKVLDEKYTRMLMARTDLDLLDVIALDKVQKGKPDHEGRVPIAEGEETGRGPSPEPVRLGRGRRRDGDRGGLHQEAGIRQGHCKKMVVELPEEVRGRRSRQDIDKLLLEQALRCPGRRPEAELHHEPASGDATGRQHCSSRG